MAGIKRPKQLKQVKLKMKLSWKNIIIYVFLILFTAFLFFGVSSPNTNSLSGENIKTVPLSQLISDVKAGKVTSLDVYPNKIVATTKDGKLESFKETDSSVYQLFKDANVNIGKTKVVIKDDTALNNWVGILTGVLPIVLMVAFFWFIFRQARGAQENIFSFGKSGAKLLTKQNRN